MDTVQITRSRRLEWGTAPTHSIERGVLVTGKLGAKTISPVVAHDCAALWETNSVVQTEGVSNFMDHYICQRCQPRNRGIKRGPYILGNVSFRTWCTSESYAGRASSLCRSPVNVKSVNCSIRIWTGREREIYT